MAEFTVWRGRWREVGKQAALLVERALGGCLRAVERFADPRRSNSIAYIGETLLRTLVCIMFNLSYSQNFLPWPLPHTVNLNIPSEVPQCLGPTIPYKSLIFGH